MQFTLSINVALRDEIAAANEKFMAAFKTQVATAVADLYTEDCKIMPPGSDVLMGREGTYICLLYVLYISKNV